VKYLRKSREIWRRYNETKPWLNQFYSTFLNLRPGLIIVDVGCGTGDFTRYLATLSKGKNRTVGIDSNEKGVAAASADTKNTKFSSMISYKVGDVYKIPLDNEYADLTCCRTLLMHLNDPLKAVKEMTRVTKIRGSVVAVEGGKMGAFFDPNDETYTELVERMYDAWLDGIRKLERKEFRIGERLPGIFQAAGLSEIKAEVQADGWLYTDPRRKLADIKQQLRFDISQFKTRHKTDRKYLIAGGMTDARIKAYNRQTLAKMKALLSNDKNLRSDPTFYAASLFLVSGTKTR
jgi:ubiquinone/menaquinone biosynthesis C-methylase UbiE